jgi:hypothetical protein
MILRGGGNRILCIRGFDDQVFDRTLSRHNRVIPERPIAGGFLA